MKSLTVLFGAAALLIFVAVNSLALAEDIKIIANPSVTVDTISEADVKRVFLEKSSLGGAHVEPVLEKNGPVHMAFVKQYLGLSDDDLQNYYRTLVFTGKGFMPKSLGTDAEVVAHVARTRGAIGYVSSSASAEGVKTLAMEVSGGAPERKLINRVEPDYPETLKLRNIGGTVRLRVFISARGNVDNVTLLGGNPILGESAEAAVKKWVYAPSRASTVAEISILFDGH